MVHKEKNDYYTKTIVVLRPTAKISSNTGSSRLKVYFIDNKVLTKPVKYHKTIERSFFPLIFI